MGHWCGLTLNMELTGSKPIDLSFLNSIIFIAVIAAMVQLVEMTLDRFAPKLYISLGIFLPLIAVNCAILVVLCSCRKRIHIFGVNRIWFGSGIGFFMAIASMALSGTGLDIQTYPLS